jgi:YbbR domain-containing protein
MIRKITHKIGSIAKERDYLAKAVCLLLAIILWAFIASGRTDRLRYRMPLSVRNVPSTLAVSGMSDRSAVIVLEGRKEHLKSINMKSIRVYVSLDDAVTGTKEYPVRMEKQQLPEEVSLSLATDTVMVTVEKKEERWVRVLPVIEGAVRKGKIIIDRMVFPERVRIIGPKSVVDSIDTLETEEVSVEDEAADLHRQVSLRGDNLADITLSEKVFTVQVSITDLKDLVMVTVPVTVMNGGRDFDYDVRDREVEVYIRSANSRIVASDDITASVDAARLNYQAVFVNESAAMASVELPVAVTGKTVMPADFISIIPRKVLVRVSRKRPTAAQQGDNAGN